jgi:hypothetical protein
MSDVDKQSDQLCLPAGFRFCHQLGELASCSGNLDTKHTPCLVQCPTSRDAARQPRFGCRQIEQTLQHSLAWRGNALERALIRY